MSPDERKILFIVAHPHLEKSRANRAVVEAVTGLGGTSIHRIYDHYPYFHIDVEFEQKRLLEHDLIVIQHPFYWYSTPALLKLWLDEVLRSGFAYGLGGDKLKDKRFLLSLTVDEPETSYRAESENRFSIDTLLTPWKQTVGLCGMKWHKPLIAFDALAMPQESLRAHGVKVRETLSAYLQKGVLP